MRMAWPERAVLVIAIAFGLLLLCFGAVLNGASPTYRWVDGAMEIEAHFAKIALLPLWLTLRIIDLLAGGPWRRKQVLIVHPPGR